MIRQASIDEVLRRIALGESRRHIARETGICRASIDKIASGQRTEAIYDMSGRRDQPKDRNCYLPTQEEIEIEKRRIRAEKGEVPESHMPVTLDRVYPTTVTLEPDWDYR